MSANNQSLQIGAPTSNQINAQAADYPVFGSNAEQWDFRRNQSYLDEESWREIDDLMVEAAEDELALFDRLRQRNLVDSVPLEKTISIWRERTGSAEAEIDMDGRSQTVESLPEGGPAEAGVPIPLIAAAFRLGHRGMEAAADIRDVGVDQAARAVLEEYERFIVEGWAGDVDDAGDGGPFTIHGVTTHPDRNTATGNSWSTDATNVENDILTMIEAAEDDRFNGPYDLWLNPDQVRPMREPSTDYDNMRVREVIDDLPEIDSITTSEWIPAGEGVLVDLQRQVIDAKLGDGNVTQTAEWDNTPFETRYKVYGAFAPRVKSRPVGDGTRESGVVHITGIA